MSIRHELFHLLGKLLEYPTVETPMYGHLCLDLLDGWQPGAAAQMAEFAAYAESTRLGRLEEQYSASFDLSPECSPYAGCQLLSEDPKRAVLMVKLRECYRNHGFVEGRELPDHVAVILGFLARLKDPELEMELARELLLPALTKMADAIGERNPYRYLLRAATLALSDLVRDEHSALTPALSNREREPAIRFSSGVRVKVQQSAFRTQHSALDGGPADA